MTIENEGATAVVEDQVAVEEQPKSMDDTIRETLQSLNERGAVPEVPPEEIPEEPEAKAQRIRDEHGKFAAKPAAEASSAAAPVDPLAPAEPVSQAPNTWKKEAAAVWEKLPPEARNEIQRREADFHRGIEQYKGAAQFAQTMERAITPHVALIESYGITPDKAISELLQSVNILRNGAPQEKAAHFAQLAQHYGIDINQLPQVQPVQLTNDPRVQAMWERQLQAEQQAEQTRLQEQQRAEQALNSEIVTFAADPKHSHFETVKPHMIALLQAGQAKDLSDAYEQAVFANPTTRATMLQQQIATKQKENAQKAQAARSASSVNTRKRPSMPVSEPIGSMDDTIRATLRRIQGA